MLDIDLNNCNYIAAIDEDQALQGVESIVSQNSMVDYCVALVWKIARL